MELKIITDWAPVSENDLPPLGENVLALIPVREHGCFEIYFARLNEENKWEAFRIEQVPGLPISPSHWMPIPAPPEFDFPDMRAKIHASIKKSQSRSRKKVPA